jgi:voltage-gated potassium channel
VAKAKRMMFQILQYFMKSVLRNPPVPLRLFALIIAVLVYGASGFLYFEFPANPDLTWFDGLWYTVVTMTTVGYGDFFPKTQGGRFLVGWPVMVFGIGLLGYALSVIAAALITSKTKEMRGMSSFSLKNHLVIFNYPGAAKVQRILEELSLDPVFRDHKQVVLVDEHLEELPPELVKRNVHFIKGNPVRNETLSRASMASADHALILSRNENDPASDNLNVSIALAVEGFSKKVDTVVEIVDSASAELLKKTGCDRIVCTSRLGAYFLNQELVNPGVQEVIEDLLSAEKGQNIYLVEVSRSWQIGEVQERCRRKGHLFLGIRTADRVLLNPNTDTAVEPGDKIITVGTSRIEAL